MIRVWGCHGFGFRGSRVVGYRSVGIGGFGCLMFNWVFHALEPYFPLYTRLFSLVWHPFCALVPLGAHLRDSRHGQRGRTLKPSLKGAAFKYGLPTFSLIYTRDPSYSGCTYSLYPQADSCFLPWGVRNNNFRWLFGILGLQSPIPYQNPKP